MYMKIVFAPFVLLCFLLLPGKAAWSQTLKFEWAKSIGSASFDIGKSIALDGTSLVVTGQFDGVADFDPGPGVYNLSSNGGVDLYVLKLDTSGQFIWAKQFGNTQFENATCIQTDNLGNIYVTGIFTGAVDFDPGPGVFNVSSGTGSACFVLKLNSAGDLVWARSYIGVNLESFTLDAGYNIIATGYFWGSIDFDPGPGIFTATTNSTSTKDIYILKLDNNGNFSWMKQLHSVLTGIFAFEAYSIKTDASQNIYIGGSFSSTVDFDPGPGSSVLTSSIQDIYLLRLDPSGNFQWVKTSTGGTSTRILSMELDPAGNIYCTGTFTGTVDFDPGPAAATLSSPLPSQVSAYILKLDNNGNFLFVKQFVNTASRVSGAALTLDASDNIYIGGTYFGQVDLDPGPGTFTIGTPSFFGGAFITKLDRNGNFMWGINYQMNGESLAAYSLKTDILKNIYFTGTYYGTVDFDPTAAVYSLTSQPLPDINISKLSQCNNSTSTITASSCSSYTLNGIPYTTSGTYYQTLPNAVGCDSIIRLDLSISPILSSSSATACDRYTWNNQTLTSSGIYRDTFLLASGCDSISVLHLTINSSAQTTIHASICEGQSYGSYTSSGTYTDLFTTLSGCDSTRILHLTVNPIIRTSINAAICKGEIYAGYSNSGTYTDIFTSVAGCDSIRTLQLVVHPLPVPALGNDTVLCNGASLVLSPGNFNSYNWNNGSSSGSITITATGMYWVEVTDQHQCRATDSILVSPSSQCVLFAIPSGFTPNNDGLNDIFKPIINMPVTRYEFRIFNRWGQVVFQTRDPAQGWNGKLDGAEQDPASFIFVISFMGPGEKKYFEKGTFVLVR